MDDQEEAIHNLSLRIVTLSTEGLQVWEQKDRLFPDKALVTIPGEFNEQPTLVLSGTLAAAASKDRIILVNTQAASLVAEVSEPNVAGLLFDPDGKILISYRPQRRNTEDTAEKVDRNLIIWRVSMNSESITLTEILRCTQGKWPSIYFGGGPSQAFLVRAIAGRLLIHSISELLSSTEETDPTANLLGKLEVQLPANKSPTILPASGHSYFALFVPQHQKRPASVRVFSTLNLREDNVIVRLNFSMGDDATMSWNPSDSVLAVTLHSEMVKSSYYGSSRLYMLNVNQRRQIPVTGIPPTDPVHDAKWSPKSTASELIVVHGNMPHTKTTILDASGTALYLFPVAPRNTLHWSPNSKIFMLGGSGNLAGDFHIYERAKLTKGSCQQLGQIEDKAGIQLWAPDSRAFLTAQIFSRLRLDNRFTIWSYNGQSIQSKRFERLYAVQWITTEIPSEVADLPYVARETSQTEKPKVPWRPPSARSSKFAAMLREQRVEPTAPNQVKEECKGPVGAVVVTKKKKKKRRTRR